MTREDLVNVVRWHEQYCYAPLNTGVDVEEVVELVDGILAVRDADNNFTLYFDREKWAMTRLEGTGVTDLWAGRDLKYSGFVGHIKDSGSKHWTDIRHVARIALRSKTPGISWHHDPIPVKY